MKIKKMFTKKPKETKKFNETKTESLDIEDDADSVLMDHTLREDKKSKDKCSKKSVNLGKSKVNSQPPALKPKGPQSELVRLNTYILNFLC